MEAKVYENHRRDARYNEVETAPTLTALMGTGGGNVPLCKEKTDFTLTSVDRYCTIAIGHDSSHLTTINGAAHTLSACDCNAPQMVLKRGEEFVRKLTPLECERLQGLPDNWTAYGSDTKRYKAIGNGMAQPCADFVIEKLVEVLKERG